MTERFTAVSAVLLAACASGRAPAPDFSGVGRIEIVDEWNGLSPAAPIVAHYRLERGDDAFDGTAELSAGHDDRYSTAIEPRGRRTRTLPVTIPLADAEAFLDALARSPLDHGRYEPRIDHTDDYPAIRIVLGTGADSIVFFTKSQGEGHVPWGARVAGREHVVRSAQPWTALQLLEPHLHGDTLEAMIEALMRR